MKKFKREGPKKKKVPHIRVYTFALIFLIQIIALIGLIYLLVTYQALINYIWLPFLILYILDFVVSIFILNSKVESDFKTSWLVVIIIFPYGGVFLYLLFAHKTTTRKMRKLRFNKINYSLISGKIDCHNTLKEISDINEDAYIISSYLSNNCFASVFKNTSVKYFSYGQYGFPKMLEEIKKAKKFIFVEYFIIEDGYMFNSIYKLLKQKVKEGVDVRLIYDDFGSVKKIENYFFKKARSAGIRCFAFNRIRPTVDIRQNSRDHRKIMVIDGVVGFTGGCNLADEYINKVIRFGDWKDNIIMLKGEAVTGLTNLFLSNWNLMYRKTKFENPDILSEYSYYNNKQLLSEVIESDGYVQPFGEVPFDGEDGNKNTFISMIFKAKKSIFISTPYLILDSEIQSALCSAAKSGISVKIVTPGIPDKKIVYQMSRSYYPKLLLSGVKIYEYTPGFNHAKIIVVDDDMAVTGTVNFDYRSFYLHFENSVFLFNCSVIKDIKNDMIKMVDDSKEVDTNEYLTKPLYLRLFWGILRVFAPLI